jgi:hypothetical protein
VSVPRAALVPDLVGDGLEPYPGFCRAVQCRTGGSVFECRWLIGFRCVGVANFWCWSGCRAVVVGSQGALDGFPGDPVEPYGGVECQDALDHAGEQSAGFMRAWMLDAELALEGLVDGLDPVAEPLRENSGVLLAFHGRPDQDDALVQELGLECPAAESLVAHRGGAARHDRVRVLLHE